MIKKRQKREIRHILTLLGIAVLCAGLMASFFLYYYSPSGHYLAGNTLLDPSIMEQIRYQDQHSRQGKQGRFVFDHIEFSYFDPQKGLVRILSIPLGIYQKFYTKVTSEKSLKNVSREVQDLFLRSHSAVLTIGMRDERKESHPIKIFQVVQCLPEGYFRVQLHEENEREWAYFYQPGLYEEMIHLFTDL